METPTLSVKNYRGVRIYIRRLLRETFEYLIVMDGEIFCNQVEMRRPVGKRMTKYSDEDLESAVGFLLGVAHEFIDDRLFAQQEARRWKNRLEKVKEKVGDRLFHIKYKVLEYIDNKKDERKIKRGKSN